MSMNETTGTSLSSSARGEQYNQEGNKKNMNTNSMKETTKHDNNDPDNRTFRVYDGSNLRVQEHYRDMRQYQTVAFYRRMEEKYSFENGRYRALMTMEEAIDKLDEYVDASDPDFELPNRLHLLQTAEAIRAAGHPDWFQLVGFLHDVGKIMFLWGTAEDGQDASMKTNSTNDALNDSPESSSSPSPSPTTSFPKQWALGGDTFVLGCPIPSDAVVFPQFNALYPDIHNPHYNSTPYGMYTPHCGLSNLLMAWGHDEYMYRMLVANHTTIPAEGLDMIRYHSAYPLHDRGAYRHLLQLPQDDERLEWVRQFNQYDLYTKDESAEAMEQIGGVDDVSKCMPYYQGLLEKYGLGGVLKW